MGPHSFEIFEEIVTAGFVACLLLCRALIHFMRVATNRSLPEGERISFFWPKWKRVIEKYQQLYPTGRAYRVLIGLVFCQMAIAVGAVVLIAWQTFGTKVR
jgi:hypothetical protein